MFKITRLIKFIFQGSLLQIAWRAWRNELTTAGKYLVGSMLFASFGTASVQIPVYQILCGLAALLFVTGITGVLFKPRVSIEGRFPERGTAGQVLCGEFSLSNPSRLPAFDVALGFYDLPAALQQEATEQIIPSLPRGASATVPVALRLLKRGLYDLPPLRAYATFPFNIGRFPGARRDLPPLLVFPDFQPIDGIDIPIGARYQPGGISLTSNIGESPEYIGNREYVPGEPVRRLDFRSWARLGRPVVREYHEEYYCRIALVLDTFIAPRRKPGSQGFPELEGAVSLAASVADALSQGEYLLDLFAAGPELHVFRAGRHTAHFENLLEILACVDACRKNPFETVAPALADELGNISAAICIFLDWDDSRRQLVRTILEAGCSLKVLIVRDGPTTAPLSDAETADAIQFTPAQVHSGGLGVL